MPTWDIVQTVLGAVNLVLVLKIILNDLHELRQMFFEHLRNHTKGE